MSLHRRPYNVRLSEEEIAALGRAARSKGMEPAAFLRAAIAANDPTPPTQPKIEAVRVRAGMAREGP